MEIQQFTNRYTHKCMYMYTTHTDSTTFTTETRKEKQLTTYI